MKQEKQNNETVLRHQNGEFGVTLPHKPWCATRLSGAACDCKRPSRKRIATNGANGATPHAANERACVTHVTDVTQVTDDFEETEVSEEAEDFEDTEETEDFEDTKDTKDTKETQSRPQSRPQLESTKSATISQTFARKILVELGNKYSSTSFNERSAFFLAANVMALETQCGEFPFELRKLAFDAATEKLRPDKQFSLLASYISAFKKIKKPMTGNTLVTALNNVANLGLFDLPEIPGYPLAGEKHKRILALHREMSRLCGGNEYGLSRRAMEEVARVKMKRFEALNVCALFEELRLIEIVDRGKPGKGKGKGAARYRYIGSPSEPIPPMPNPEPDLDDGEQVF